MHNGSEYSRPHADVRPVGSNPHADDEACRSNPHADDEVCGSNPHADDAMKMQPNRSQSRVCGVLMRISV